MCSVSLAITGISTAFGVISKVMEFSSQADQSAATQKAAVVSANKGYEQVGLRQQQEKVAGSQNEFETSLEARRAQASARVSGGEAGVEGVSYNAVIGEFMNRFGRFATATRASSDMTVAQLQTDKDAIKAQAEGRINAAPPPSKMGLIGNIGLGIGSAGYESYKAGDFDGLFSGSSTTPTYYSHYNAKSGY